LGAAGLVPAWPITLPMATAIANSDTTIANVTAMKTA